MGFEEFSKRLTEPVEKIDKKYNVRAFTDPPESKYIEALDPLVLDAIDLSLFQEGKQGYESRLKLSKILEKSITTYGFFNLTNYGVDGREVERLRAVAQSLLTLPEDQKEKYFAGSAKRSDQEVYEYKKQTKIGAERGSGFKPKGYWTVKKGVRDEIELFNIRDIANSELFYSRSYPEVLEYHLKELHDFYSHLHFEVTEKLLRLCDLILEVPEGTLWDKYFKEQLDHGSPDFVHAGHGRLMLYKPYDEEEAKSVEKAWLKPHTDIAAFAFITSQPILALQISDFYTGKWRFVNHRPDSLVVNIGDALEFISGGYFKACLHRVQTPPPDQEKSSRLVVIYFQNPSDFAYLDPENLGSPKLKRLGFSESSEKWDKITFSEWDNEKGKRLAKNGFDEEQDLRLYGREIERWHHELVGKKISASD